MTPGGLRGWEWGWRIPTSDRFLLCFDSQQLRCGNAELGCRPGGRGKSARTLFSRILLSPAPTVQLWVETLQSTACKVPTRSVGANATTGLRHAVWDAARASPRFLETELVRGAATMTGRKLFLEWDRTGRADAASSG